MGADKHDALSTIERMRSTLDVDGASLRSKFEEAMRWFDRVDIVRKASQQADAIKARIEKIASDRSQVTFQRNIIHSG